MRILIADDDPQILRALRITLGAKGHEIILARDGQHALDMVVERKPDIILLDLGMPRLDGIRVIEAVRGWSAVPILVISGRSGSAEKVEALDAGADDYVTKPFSMDELLARIRVLSRRVGQDEAGNRPVVEFGPVRVDLAAHTVTRDGKEVRLTPTEWRVLELLIHDEGRLVTRQTLLRNVWGSEHVTDTGYLRLYISQLRKKLEPNPSSPKYLLTEAGMGYRLVLHPDE